jgi:hypothetical protein
MRRRHVATSDVATAVAVAAFLAASLGVVVIADTAAARAGRSRRRKFTVGPLMRRRRTPRKFTVASPVRATAADVAVPPAFAVATAVAVAAFLAASLGVVVIADTAAAYKGLVLLARYKGLVFIAAAI